MALYSNNSQSVGYSSLSMEEANYRREMEYRQIVMQQQNQNSHTHALSAQQLTPIAGWKTEEVPSLNKKLLLLTGE